LLYIIDLIFAIPLAIEVDKVLQLWLNTPPESSGLLVVYLLIVRVVDRVSDGHWVAIFSMGDIAKFRIVESIMYWGMLILAFNLIVAGMGIESVGIALLVGRIGSALVKLYYGKKKVGLSIRRWVFEVLIPIGIVIPITSMIGYIPHFFMECTFLRVIVTTLLCEIILGILAWYLILSINDREKIRKLVNSMYKGCK
jgi:hypothetical protein